MRLLFLFLLLVNGLIYLWYTFSQQPVNAAPVAIDTSAPRLVLLSELPPMPEEQTLVKSEPAQPGSETQEETTPQKLCYTLGPFMNDEDVSLVTQKLMLSGRPFEKRVSERKEQIGYWVFIPPFKTRDIAVDKAEELKLLGEKHLYVLKTPEKYANAISLGVFRGKENAKRRFSELKNLGYTVKMEGRYRQNPVTWLDYTEQSDSQTLETQDMVGAQRLQRACEVIASSETLP